MNNMEKEFVTQEESFELKVLGFDEPCFGYYKNDHFTFFVDMLNCNSNSVFRFYPTAPTYSQAFRWFREKYSLTHSITDFIDDKEGIEWDYSISIIGIDLDEKGNYQPLVDYSIDDPSRKYKSYEEAELACLRKLIQIVKEKQGYGKTQFRNTIE